MRFRPRLILAGVGERLPNRLLDALAAARVGFDRRGRPRPSPDTRRTASGPKWRGCNSPAGASRARAGRVAPGFRVLLLEDVIDRVVRSVGHTGACPGMCPRARKAIAHRLVTAGSAPCLRVERAVLMLLRSEKLESFVDDAVQPLLPAHRRAVTAAAGRGRAAALLAASRCCRVGGRVGSAAREQNK